MLPLFALVALQDSAAQDSATPPPPLRLSTTTQVVRFLKDIGFEYRPSPESEGAGTLTHNGRRVDAVVESLLRRGSPSTSNVLRLETEFDVPRELTPAPDHPGGYLYVPPNRQYFQPSLGRTVRAYADVDIQRDFSPKRIKGELVRFWTAVEAYATANGGRFQPSRPRDWAKEKFDPSHVTKYVDETSLDRLFQAWGWSHPEGNYYPALDGHAFHGRIEGETIDISDHRLASSSPGLTLQATIDLEDPARKIPPGYKVRPPIDWAQTKSLGPDAFAVVQTVEFPQGIALGELRRRLRSFALHVRELKRIMGFPSTAVSASRPVQ